MRRTRGRGDSRACCMHRRAVFFRLPEIDLKARELRSHLFFIPAQSTALYFTGGVAVCSLGEMGADGQESHSYLPTHAVVYLSCPPGHERHFKPRSAILLINGFTPRYQRKRFRRNCDQSQLRPSRYPNTRLESLKHFQSSHPPSPTGHKAEEQSTDSSKRPYLEPTLGRRGGFRRLSPLP